MNPVTVRIFDITQHMMVTQFLEMCLSSSSDVDGIFAAIGNQQLNSMGIPFLNNKS